ncbi:hypothetical protein BDW66DRAFT_131080 [Aspergillus desertorum]
MHFMIDQMLAFHPRLLLGSNRQATDLECSLVLRPEYCLHSHRDTLSKRPSVSTLSCRYQSGKGTK